VFSAGKVALIAVALTGIYFLGHGAYIYAKALVAQQLLHSAWQRTLHGEVHVKPWPWADMWPVARMRAAAHDVDQIILAGDSGRVLAFGPGANFAFAAPGGDGASVVSAHRDTHFAFLRRVRINDRLEVQDAHGRWRAYAVTAMRVVDARDALEFADGSGARLMLVTCYPFDSIVPGGPLRYVVWAEASDSVQAIR
jgi:sortase A